MKTRDRARDEKHVTTAHLRATPHMSWFIINFPMSNCHLGPMVIGPFLFSHFWPHSHDKSEEISIDRSPHVSAVGVGFVHPFEWTPHNYVGRKW